MTYRRLIIEAVAVVTTAVLVVSCSSTSEERVLQSCCDTNQTPIATAAEELKSSPYVSPWPSPSARPVAPDFTFQDQKGHSVRLRDFRGAPIALSFAYTRCQNQRKCPAVARRLGELQKVLNSAALAPRPFIALVTYDPDYDTPDVLARFAEGHGIIVDSKTLLLRPATNNRADLFRSLNVAVNYRDGLVNLHGVQLILLDKQGRQVRTYHSLIWDNAAVLKDLARLAAE